MRFHLLSTVNFEQWDWRNSVEQGIGGSETSQVELAWRLARRGHDVTCYGPLPDDCSGHWRGTKWKRLEEVDYSAPGIWIVYRAPSQIDEFQPEKHGQRLWFMCQDEDYGQQWEGEGRAEKIERVLALCPDHAEHLARTHPAIADKIVITSNGLKPELIRETLTAGIARNPLRMMYASSPDRGLINLLKVFRRAREYEPNLELHCFYGLNNIDKLIELNPKFSHYKKFKAELEKEIDQPGVTWHGRVDQHTLYREWAKSGMWVYPTSFRETSCITSMEAQGLGAMPILSPVWALRTNVQHGWAVPGDPSIPLTRARFVSAILQYVQMDPEQREQMRSEMQRWALVAHNWERWVDQLETWSDSDARGQATGVDFAQYHFQQRHAFGDILNVGCNTDVAGFGRRGGINVDICEVDPHTGNRNAADMIADARCLPGELHGRFNTVVLGEILEHFTDEDAQMALCEARLCLQAHGRIVVTVPCDHRSAVEQGFADDTLRYTEGVTGHHARPITPETVERWARAVGLRIALKQEMDYGFCPAHGFVLEVAQ